MSRSIEPEELAALGIDASRLGDAATLPWPTEPVGLGQAPPAAAVGLAALLAQGLSQASFLEAGVPVLERLGARLGVLAGNPHVIKLTGPPDEPPRARPSRAGPGALHVDVDDPSTLLLDLDSAGATLLTMPDGTGVVLALRPEGLHLVRVLSPLEAWCRSCGDKWLVREVESRFAEHGGHGLWPATVGAGVFSRLRLPPEGGAGQAAIEALLAGRVDPEPARPRAWVRSLRAEDRRAVDARGAREATALERSITRLADEPAPEDSGWRDDLTRAAQARDDLEGVRVLLHDAGGGQGTDAALGPIDRAGRALVARLPRGFRLPDERLRRIALGDPGAWWGAGSGFERFDPGRDA
jgi:hypothetical protein